MSARHRTQRAGGVASGLRRAKRVARHGNGQQDDEKTEFKGGKVTIELINFLRYTHFNNSTGYWGPREEYKGKPVPPNGRASLWMEEAQMPENALKAFQTTEGDKPAK